MYLYFTCSISYGPNLYFQYNTKQRFVIVVPKYLNSAEIYKDIFAIFMLRFSPALLWWDKYVYLLFSAFISRPNS
jgi:hypothetical protein